MVGGAAAAPDAVASEALVALVGPTLKRGTEEVASADALAGKVVAIYFSAHWCPPCRGFTPKLAEAYKKYQKLGKNLEIVFVSSDKDQAAFDEYFGEMPWLAVPYSDRARKDALSKKFKVRGIPSLVVLDEDGSTITTDGRSAVMEDPEGAAFPWRPKPLSELLAGDFVGAGGEAIPASSLASKHIGLYFSAHWCPPCRGFTPKLAAFYKEFTKTRGAELEIVFASSDKDQAAFDEYFGEMPWLALPYADRARKDALSKAFDVSGIPSFIILSPEDAAGNRQVINKSARGAIAADPDGAEFPWHPKPCEELSATVECNGFDVNEKPALVCLLDTTTDDATKAALSEAMRTIGAEAAAAGKAAEDGEPAMIFFTAASGDGPVGQVRRMTGAPDKAGEPALLLLDIPDNGGYYLRGADEGPLDEAAIRAFVAKYQAGTLDRQQLGSN